MVRVAKKAKSQHKLTRKEIKEDDQFIQTTQKSADWLQDNKREVTFLLVGIFALFIGFFIFRGVQSQGNLKASITLEKALKVSEATIDKDKKETDEVDEDEAITFKSQKKKDEAIIKAFEVVIKKHPRTRPSSLAHLSLAHAFTKAGKYDDAKKNYDIFLLQMSKQDPLYFLGVSGTAQLLEKQKKAGESEKKLQHYREKGLKELKDHASFQLAEYYMYNKKNAKARKLYEEIKKNKESPFKEEATKRLASIP